jgi:uncharacterized membrane protein YqhA
MSDHQQTAQSYISDHPVEKAFEVVVFASRWIQAPLYGGLIITELLYAYKFLVELWEMVIHITFLGSAILLAWTDKIMQKDRRH